MKKVIIASKNPVKINATKKAFEDVFTNRFEFEGVSADSLVSDQPKSDKETLEGATNRLKNIQHLEADYFVSIEGGVDLLDESYEVFAWIVISDKHKIGKAKTLTMFDGDELKLQKGKIYTILKVQDVDIVMETAENYSKQ